MKSSAHSLALSAVMTALTAVLSPLSVPFGAAAFTLQTFAVALTGYLLAPRAAFLSVLAYLLLGACGLPVFSMFHGGFGVLLGPTGGFLIGFPVMALLCALGQAKPRLRLLAGLAGLLVVYVTGTAQMSCVLQISLRHALLTGAVPFILKDILSVLGASALSRIISRRLHRILRPEKGRTR